MYVNIFFDCFLQERHMARILLAEDDDDQRQKFAAKIKSLGHVVVEAQHGGVTFDLLTTQTFDLVVTDVQMPCLSGWGLLQSMWRRGIKTKTLVHSSEIMFWIIPGRERINLRDSVKEIFGDFATFERKSTNLDYLEEFIVEALQ
jgi:DNA-binding NtrC family response regulator